MDIVLIIGLVMISYLFGSISFGRLLARGQKVDVTTQGSGNTGATNMLRTYGAKLGALTLLLDLLKGIIPALVGYFAFGGAGAIPDSYIGLYACGLATVLGHIFPLYYKFKGGKAAATACGVFLVAQPVIALCAFVLCVGLAFIIKYVSPMSLVFMFINVLWQCLFMPEFTFAPGESVAVVVLVVLIGVAVYGAHWQNIVRLFNGTERRTDLWAKFTEKVKKSSDENKQISEQEIEQDAQDEVKIEKEADSESLNESNEILNESSESLNKDSEKNKFKDSENNDDAIENEKENDGESKSK